MDVLSRIKALGCSNKANIMMAHQTHSDLTTERFTEVTCHYDNDLDVIYLQGRKDDVESIFLPVHSSFTFSLTWIRNVQNKLCRDEKKSIILVIQDGDSSSVRYKLSEGVIMPSTESNRILRKGNEHSKNQVLSGESVAPSTSKVAFV